VSVQHVQHLRPRSIPELIDASVQLARRYYVPLLLIAAVVAIPALVLGLANMWVVPRPDAVGEAPAQIMTDALLALPLGLLGVAWAFVGFGALVGSAGAAYTTGTPLAVDAALRQALSRAGSLVGGNMLAYLYVLIALVLGGIVLALVAGAAGAAVGLVVGRNVIAVGVVTAVAVAAGVVGFLALVARYVNVTAAVMLEGARAVEAVRRSRALSDGSVKRIMALLVVVFGLLAVLWVTLLIVLATVFQSPVLASAIMTVATMPLQPVFGCVFALLYYDLRIRKEGYDLELMARELGEAPAAAEGAAGQPSF
jgi:hypothetical protein